MINLRSFQTSVAAFTHAAFSDISVADCDAAVEDGNCLRTIIVGTTQSAALEFLEDISHSPYSFIDDNAYFQRFTNISILNVTFPALEAPYVCAILSTCIILGASPPYVADQGFISTTMQVRCYNLDQHVHQSVLYDA